MIAVPLSFPCIIRWLWYAPSVIWSCFSRVLYLSAGGNPFPWIRPTSPSLGGPGVGIAAHNEMAEPGGHRHG
jgi:hypothetical protein